MKTLHTPHHIAPGRRGSGLASAVAGTALLGLCGWALTGLDRVLETVLQVLALLTDPDTWYRLLGSPLL